MGPSGAAAAGNVEVLAVVARAFVLAIWGAAAEHGVWVCVAVD